MQCSSVGLQSRMKKILKIVVLGFLLSGNAYSVTMSVKGYNSCGEYLEWVDSNNDMNVSWAVTYVEGYITGANDSAGTNKTYNDRDGLKYALENYCRKNPLSDTFEGARHIYYNILR